MFLRFICPSIYLYIPYKLLNELYFKGYLRCLTFYMLNDYLMHTHTHTNTRTHTHTHALYIYLYSIFRESERDAARKRERINSIYW